MNNIDNTLAERGSRYGAFEGHADITQSLKAVMQSTPNWDLLKPDQKEALDMTAHKIGRILNGDPDYIDSWHDIVGYTRLVEQRLEREQAPKDAQEAQAQNEKISGISRDAATRAGEMLSEAYARLAEIEPKKACGCPACEMRRKLEKFFGTNVEVVILIEDSGLTD